MGAKARGLVAAVMLVATVTTALPVAAQDDRVNWGNITVRHWRRQNAEWQGATVMGAMNMLGATGVKCRTTISAYMVMAALATTGSSVVDDSQQLSAGVTYVMVQIYGCRFGKDEGA